MKTVLTLLLLAAPLQVNAADFDLVFSLKTWEGEYATKDIPGGVQVTPTLGSIHTIRSDGTGLKQIVKPGERIDFPIAGPDGRWLYFQSRIDGSTQVSRCKWDGSERTSLTPPERLTKAFADSKFKVKDAYGSAFSSDGRKMLFTVHDGQSGRVVLADPDGGSPQLLAPNHGYIYMASLSPAADRVVFSGPARGYRLGIIDLPDGKPRELTPDHPESFVPRFTPDGKTIVFFRRDGDIYRIDADGKNLKRLTEGNRYVEFRLSPKDLHGSTDGPDISPDGKRIAFIAMKDNVPNVFTIDLDGGNRKQITMRSSPCGRVKWSPDGKQLSFVSFEGKYPQLFVVPAEGGEPRQLTKLDGAVYFANWK